MYPNRFFSSPKASSLLLIGLFAGSLLFCLPATRAQEPVILQSPADFFSGPEVTVTLSVSATNATAPFTLFYRWYRNGNVLTDGGRVTGATNSQLTLANVTPADSGPYYVAVSDSAGHETVSDIAQLHITTNVTFHSAAMENAVRSYLNKFTGSISPAEMTSLVGLQVEFGGAAQSLDLTGIEYAHNLASFNIRGTENSNALVNAAALRALTKLNELTIDNCALTNLDFLAHLGQLEYLELENDQLRDFPTNIVLPDLSQLNLNGNALMDARFISATPAVTELYLGENQIHDVAPLLGLDLEVLTLRNNPITNSEVLAAFSHLSYLHLSGTPISNADFTATMSFLNILTLDHTPLTSIAFVSQLPTLYDLDVSDTLVRDFTPLLSLTNLQSLEAANDGIANLSFLSPLAAISSLTLSGNPITNLVPLRNLTLLNHLSLNGCQLQDISDLAPLANLNFLDLSFNTLTHFSALGGLTQLTWLSLNNNQVADIAPLAGLTNLEMLLQLSDNRITNLSAVVHLAKLVNLNVANNRLTVLPALGQLTQLEVLAADNNQLRDVYGLAGLASLHKLHLGDNDIQDISALAGLIGLGVADLHNNYLNTNSSSAAAIIIQTLLDQSTAVTYLPQHAIAPASLNGPARGSANQFRFTVISAPGQFFELQRSADLKNWVPITTFSNANGSLTLTNPTAGGLTGFYRLKNL